MNLCCDIQENDRIEDYRKMPVNSVNTAFQGVLSNDKCAICLPRQYTNRARKPLIFLDFLKLTEKIYYLFTTYQNY